MIRHTRLQGDWSSDVCSSDLYLPALDAVLRSHPGPQQTQKIVDLCRGPHSRAAARGGVLLLDRDCRGDPLDGVRSEEHTSELQSPCNLVCRLLLEKKKNTGRHSMTG